MKNICSLYVCCKYIYLLIIQIQSFHHSSPQCQLVYTFNKCPSQKRSREREASACIVAVRCLFQKHVPIHQSMMQAITCSSLPFFLQDRLVYTFSKSPRSQGDPWDEQDKQEEVKMDKRLLGVSYWEKSREAQAGEKGGVALR